LNPSVIKNILEVNWNHLFAFYQVGKNHSLKKAAAQMSIAPSTLSEQIKKLEKNFGLKLFTRTQQGMVLNKDGRKLFKHSKTIFESAGKMIDEFSPTNVGGYPVNVGIEDSIFQDLAIQFADQYWDLFTPYGTVNTLKRPEYQVLIDDLISGNLDWGITNKIPKRKRLDFEEIGHYQLSFCVVKEVYEQFKHSEDILENIPLALSSWDQGLNDTINSYLRRHEIHPKEHVYSDHPQYIKKLCNRGRCIMLIVDSPLEEFEGLKKIDLGSPLSLPFYAVWKKSDENLISIRKLKDLLRLKKPPESYQDQTFQLQASDVDQCLLN
jgi:DNA-binding transcriptional LysR family regulator